MPKYETPLINKKQIDEFFMYLKSVLKDSERDYTSWFSDETNSCGGTYEFLCSENGCSVKGYFKILNKAKYEGSIVVSEGLEEVLEHLPKCKWFKL